MSFPVTVPAVLFGWVEPLVGVFAALWAMCLPVHYYRHSYPVKPAEDADFFLITYFTRSYGCLLLSLAAISFAVFSGAILYIPLMLKKVFLAAKLASDYVHVFAWLTPLAAKSVPRSSWNWPSAFFNVIVVILIAGVRIAYLAGAWDGTDSFGVVNGSRSWLCQGSA